MHKHNDNVSNVQVKYKIIMFSEHIYISKTECSGCK